MTRAVAGLLIVVVFVAAEFIAGAVNELLSPH